MRASIFCVLGLLIVASSAQAGTRKSCETEFHRFKALDPKPSCSAGTRSGGRLLHGARLPDSGCGFQMLFPHREHYYGTDELVRAIARVSQQLSDETFSARLPNGDAPPLGIGNLSGPHDDRFEKDPFIGKRFSVSHVSGRSADLAYFILDNEGQAHTSFETGIGYGRDGRNFGGFRRFYRRGMGGAILSENARCRMGLTFLGLSEWKCFVPPETYRLDDRRNWALVRELLLDPEIGVIDSSTGRVRMKDQGIRRLLLSDKLRDRLLVEAFRSGDPKPLIDVAAAVMTQPSNAPPHDDHLHVDLNCSDQDIIDCGCVNTGIPPRPHVGMRVLLPGENLSR